MRRLDGVGSEGPLAPYGVGFAESLLDHGYATSTVSHHLRLMGWLSRWLAKENLAPEALSEVVAHRFRRGQGAGWPRAAECRTRSAADVSSRVRCCGVTGAGVGRVAAAISAAGL